MPNKHEDWKLTEHFRVNRSAFKAAAIAKVQKKREGEAHSGWASAAANCCVPQNKVLSFRGAFLLWTAENWIQITQFMHCSLCHFDVLYECKAITAPPILVWFRRWREKRRSSLKTHKHLLPNKDRPWHSPTAIFRPPDSARTSTSPLVRHNTVCVFLFGTNGWLFKTWLGNLLHSPAVRANTNKTFLGANVVNLSSVDLHFPN